MRPLFGSSCITPSADPAILFIPPELAVDFGNSSRFDGDRQRAFQRLIRPNQIVKSLIDIRECGIRFEIVVVEFAQALPGSFGSAIAFDEEQSTADNT